MSHAGLPSDPGPASATAGDAAWNRRFILLVIVSFIYFAGAVVLPPGIGATPSGTTGSAVRPMGFNDTLSTGHYLVILQRFRPAELLKPRYACEWLLPAMQATGAWLLLAGRRIPVRLTRWFFAVQPVLFPLMMLEARP